MKLKKYKFSRRYEDDVFGDIVLKGKENKVTAFFQKVYKEREERKKQFVFRIDVVQPRRKKLRFSQYGGLLRDLRKICGFYGGLRRKQLYKLIVDAKIEKGNLTDNVVSKLESRLETFLYRVNFATSIEEGGQMIREGVVMVNKEIIVLRGYKLKEGDIVEVLEPRKERVYESLINRLDKGWLYTSLPKYVEVNYKIMGACWLYKPTVTEVAFPFKLDYDFFSKLDVSRV